MSGRSASRFGSFQDIGKLRGKREIVLFAGGNVAEKTLRRLERKPVLIVDNNPNMWETEQLGLSVKAPKALKKLKASGAFVIICTTSFDEVSEQLEKMGFSAGRDFLVSPIMNDLRVISEIESLKTRLLFVSGATSADEKSEYGGGIYELSVDGDWTFKKVFNGTTHGLIKLDGDFIATHDKLGLIELDRKYKLVRNKEIPSASRAHGIAHSEETGEFFVALSYKDSILVFDKDFNQTGEIAISPKWEREGTPQHHINDVCVMGTSLYVSMFSYTGNWKRDIFDGVVLEIDLVDRKVLSPVITDLWMPHNVMGISGCLTVLDSLRGQLRSNNAQVIGQFPGFSRGLAHDGVYYYVGQSRNRNFSRCLNVANTISIDTAIIVFDENAHVSKSLSLPTQISEIHSVAVL